MLVLSRKRGETIKIGDEIYITITDIRGRGGDQSKVLIGIDAPQSVRIERAERAEERKESNE